MHVAVVGAGPTGLFSSLTLARRGHRVTLIDRDPGPPEHGHWERSGVMQFHQAHSFRGPVVELLAADLPDALDRLIEAGAVISSAPDGRPAVLRCRRSTFDSVLWSLANNEPGITLVAGQNAILEVQRGRATGVRVGPAAEGNIVPADLVLDATGRNGRLAEDTRPDAHHGDCGVVYTTRQYRFRTADSATAVPQNSPIGLSLAFAEYFAIAFLHDAGTFSITIAHDGSDRRLRNLRHVTAFDAAVDAIPQLRDWVKPTVSQPISAVLPAGRIGNAYRGQLNRMGEIATPGLIRVGDAVCTTTPLAGRGVTLALMQVHHLVELIDTHDIETATTLFDDWCDVAIKPWFDDHCRSDSDRVRRWSGGDVDLANPLPSDLIVAAAVRSPEINLATAAFARMDALPASLEAIEPAARQLYATGWRPTLPMGPTRAELAEIVTATTDEGADIRRAG